MLFRQALVEAEYGLRATSASLVVTCHVADPSPAYGARDLSYVNIHISIVTKLYSDSVTAQL